MKTAIFIQDGDTQLVLTPETKWEESVLKGIADGKEEVEIRRGEFYECQGGWWRGGGGNDSLILRMKVSKTA